MDKLSELIKVRLGTHHLSAASQSSEILFAANKILASHFPATPEIAKAYRLEGGKLFVRAENPVMAQELWGVQAQLLKALQSSFGEKAVQKVVLKWFDISPEVD